MYGTVVLLEIDVQIHGGSMHKPYCCQCYHKNQQCHQICPRVLSHSVIQSVTQRYIGKTERELREQISKHRGYVYNKNLSQATGAHFNLPGHQLSDMKVTILEKVKKWDENYRKERESFYIRIFNTFYRGINRRPQLDWYIFNFV